MPLATTKNSSAILPTAASHTNHTNLVPVDDNATETQTLIFLQTRAAQGIAGTFAFAAILITCHQVIHLDFWVAMSEKEDIRSVLSAILDNFMTVEDTICSKRILAEKIKYCLGVFWNTFLKTFQIIYSLRLKVLHRIFTDIYNYTCICGWYLPTTMFKDGCGSKCLLPMMNIVQAEMCLYQPFRSNSEYSRLIFMTALFCYTDTNTAVLIVFFQYKHWKNIHLVA